jgi:hypothetical protein
MSPVTQHHPMALLSAHHTQYQHHHPISCVSQNVLKQSEVKRTMGRPSATSLLSDHVKACIAVNVAHHNVPMRKAADVALLWMGKYEGLFFSFKRGGEGWGWEGLVDWGWIERGFGGGGLRGGLVGD